MASRPAGPLEKTRKEESSPTSDEIGTAPHEVRRVLALRPDALTAQSRLFVEEIARWQKRAANVNGETGAVTFVQRFDSTLGCVVPRGPARAFATPTLPRARKKKKRTAKTPDDASPFGASAEGTSPERRGDSKNTVRSGPRTGLGDGVVKPPGSRIAWAQLLRRVSWVDVLACPCGGRRAIVGDISDSEVVVAILALLKRPTEAPPIARARSPTFEGG